MAVSLSAVTMNSDDPERTARFWAEALGGVVADGGNGFVHVRSDGLLLIVQPVAHRRRDPDTDVHLDLHGDDQDAEVARLAALGAEVVERRSDSHGRWTVMRDPDGRMFCVG